MANVRVWKGIAAGLQHCQLRSLIQTDNWPSRRLLETGCFGWPGAGTSLCGCWPCWMMSSVWKEGKMGLSRKISIPFCKNLPGSLTLRVDAFQSQQSLCCTLCYWRHAALCFLWWGEHPDLHSLHLYSTTKASLGRIIGFSACCCDDRGERLLWKGGQRVCQRDHGLALFSCLCAHT